MYHLLFIESVEDKKRTKSLTLKGKVFCPQSKKGDISPFRLSTKSPDFIGSLFCFKIELTNLEVRNDANEANVRKSSTA